ncbi:MAG: aspartyl protease family protein [Bacteroidetes bacterium]|nr:aspartyl protease family protein [Bacteroidota bacterium]
MKLATVILYRCLLILLLPAAIISFGFVHFLQSRGEESPIMVNLTILPLSNYSSTDPEAIENFDELTLPLKRAGRLFLVEAIIDGESGNLVFDTGATGLVLNRTYFRNHACIECGPSNGITGTTGNIANTIARDVRIGGLQFQKIRADVSDLSHIENRRGVKIIGLMGFNMIKSFEIVIDANQNELHLYRIDRKGNRIKSDEQIPVQDHIQKIEPWHPVLIVKGIIAGKQLNFCFDSGAETNAISNHAPKNVLNTISITRRSGLKGAGQATSEVLFGTMNDFMLDKTSLNEMETIVTNLDALSEVYGVTIDGMLGYNFLEKGIITINLVKKQFSVRYSKPATS